MVLVAALLTVAGCSSTPPPPSGPSPAPSVADTSWSGSCQGLEVGTYTFGFGPVGPDGSGTVTIAFPNAAQGTRTAPYSTPVLNGGQQQQVVGWTRRGRARSAGTGRTCGGT